MNVSLIINESQVANGSVTMVTCIGEVVKLDVGDTGMKRVPKTSRNLDFCNKGKGLHPSVSLCQQRFWYTFIPLDSHSQ